MLNKTPTVINPNVPGEQPPGGTEPHMKEYLSRMFRYCSQALRRVFDWQKVHVAITDPLMEEDPHPQYAHIFNDSAYGHAILDQLVAPVLITEGSTIKPFDSLYIPSKKVGIDTANGQFTFTPDDSGIYLLNLNGYFGAQGAKSTIFVKVYANGAPTDLQFIVRTQTAIDTNFTSWGGIIQIGNNGGTAEFVVASTDPPGGVLEVYYLNVSITKQWPLLNSVPI
jgi:hypothetical protein